MVKKEPWYIKLRSNALAIVYLTRRDDLIVSQQQKGTGLDLLVTITKDGNHRGRIFGVEVKATVSSSELIQHQNSFRLKNIRHNIESFKDLPFPFCLFFFTLDNDKTYYKWILEPIVKYENDVTLKFNGNTVLKNLNDESIDNIITIVNRWYDSKNKLL
ncbi:hypothetical protein NIES4074_06670 [Cylindrospermum sp. NIES-4074]|nr:hypothetical protein NIES4074_06670 [Cylindrospermum sp. NIES-4074]